MDYNSVYLAKYAEFGLQGLLRKLREDPSASKSGKKQIGHKFLSLARSVFFPAAGVDEFSICFFHTKAQGRAASS